MHRRRPARPMPARCTKSPRPRRSIFRCRSEGSSLVRRRSLRWYIAFTAGLALLAGAIALLMRPPAGERRLRPFVYKRPPVPIVFTSRSEPASLRAAADVGEGFTYPGQGLWQAAEGRLRLLQTNGSVHE